jgi:tRNA 2-thiouridine synthesizing protein E
MHAAVTTPVATPVATARPAERVLPRFDADGYLAEPGDWTPQLAAALAREAGIDELGALHWKVIGLVRERYFAFGGLPVMRLVCRAAGLDPRQGHRLFSSCASLWRIAGLPNPGEEAKAYMH